MAEKKTGAELALEADIHAKPTTRRKKSAPDETVSIPQHMMDGLGEDKGYGTGLRLHIKALPIRYQAQVQRALQQAIPPIMLMAVISDRYGRGIDETLVTAQYNLVLAGSQRRSRLALEQEYNERLKNAKEGQDLPEPLPDIEPFTPMSPGDVHAEIMELQHLLIREADQLSYPEGSGQTRFVEKFAEAIYPLVKETPGLREENLPAMIEEHLTLADIVDIARDCINAYGPQPDSLFDRFGTH